MSDRLREYIDAVFSEAPQTLSTVEMKEEFHQNLVEKYSDLLSEGKSEEAAYNIAVASIGDVSYLVAELQGIPNKQREQHVGIQRYKQRRAVVLAIAVMLYIVCVVPVILLQNEIGVIAMFSVIAAATGLMVYNSMTKMKYESQQVTVVDDFQEWRGLNVQSKRVYRAVVSAVWSLCLIFYFLLSFFTNAWHLTWLIFPLTAAVNQIIKAIFELSR